MQRKKLPIALAVIVGGLFASCSKDNEGLILDKYGDDPAKQLFPEGETEQTFPEFQQPAFEKFVEREVSKPWRDVYSADYENFEWPDPSAKVATLHGKSLQMRANGDESYIRITLKGKAKVINDVKAEVVDGKINVTDTNLIDTTFEEVIEMLDVKFKDMPRLRISQEGNGRIGCSVVGSYSRTAIAGTNKDGVLRDYHGTKESNEIDIDRINNVLKKEKLKKFFKLEYVDENVLGFSIDLNTNEEGDGLAKEIIDSLVNRGKNSANKIYKAVANGIDKDKVQGEFHFLCKFYSQTSMRMEIAFEGTVPFKNGTKINLQEELKARNREIIKGKIASHVKPPYSVDDYSFNYNYNGKDLDEIDTNLQPEEVKISGKIVMTTN